MRGNLLAACLLLQQSGVKNKGVHSKNGFISMFIADIIRLP